MANPPAKHAPAAQNSKSASGQNGGANKNSKNSNDNPIQKVLERLRTCDNVLITLSKNPTIDELTAALGFTYILDKVGKHATAIFSGAIPNVIEFLEPEKTFEQNTNSLQDFIVAINKEKADHLRYKIDGDYVKVFITPYKTTITEADMEFSHGDYNVDLVIALNVQSEEDLDAALTEYGRIMHDASSINISAGEPQKFGDIEWSDPEASSISEMIARLASHIRIEGIEIFDKDIATTLLTGIIAATNRFSNERTTSETMAVSAKLLAAGADQQLISSNVPVDILTQEPEPEPEPVVEQEQEQSNEQYDDETVLAEDYSADEPVADVAARATERAKAAELARRQEAEAKAAEIKAAKEKAAAADPTSLSIDHSAPSTQAPQRDNIELTSDFDASESATANDEQSVDFVSSSSDPHDELRHIMDAATKKESEAESLLAARQAVEDKVRAELNGANQPTDSARASVNALDDAIATAAAAAPISPAAIAADKINVAGTVVPSSMIDGAAAQAVPQLPNAEGILNGGAKHVIEPLNENDPEQAKSKPKDYSALMDAALNDAAAEARAEIAAPVAPAAEAPAPAPAENAEPTVAPEAVATPPHIPTITELFANKKKEEPAPAPEEKPEEQPMSGAVKFVPLENLGGGEIPNGELVLPMPDANSILPPPPAPFEPSATPSLPNDSTVPTMPAPIGEVSSVSDDADPQLPVVPIQPATLTEAGDDQPKANQANEVYPDPSAFKIPGM